MGFDLSAMLEQVSNLDTNEKPTMEYIDLDLIDTNDANFYELSNLKPLADSIAMDGLQQPLIVMPNGERYTLLSGHRRRAALKQLIYDDTEPREDLRMVPCIKRSYKSPAMAELQLILANSTARVLTSAETMRQAERIEMVLYQLKEEGYEFPGRMRDQVAAACQVSASKLARLKVIRENLEQPFLEQFEKNELSEQAAYNLARLPMDFQWKVRDALGKKIVSGSAAENLAKYQEKLVEERTCTHGFPGDPCENEQGRIKATACPKYGWQSCEGGCCMQCLRADSCPGVCKIKKQDLKDGKIRRKRAEEAAARRQAKAFKENRFATKKNAQRILKAAEAAEIAANVNLACGNYSYDYTVTLSELRKVASGEALEGKDFYSPGYLPSRENVIQLSKKLGCSTDYLLGLTDELRPTAAEPKWHTGEPAESCTCAAKFMVPGMDEPMMSIAKWDGYRWAFRKGGSVEAECVGWFPLPEDE